MASSDDILEGSVSSILVESLKSNQTGDALSPEEICWVDSCLVKDPEVLDGDWSSMKDALTEILGLQSKSNDYYSTPETDIEMLHSAEPVTVNTSGRSDVNSVLINKETEPKDDNFLMEEETGISLLPTTSLGNAFLPNYREDNHREMESIGSGLDISYSAYQMEPLDDDWSSMKDALTKILGLHYYSTPGNNIEMLHSAESRTLNASGKTDFDFVLINKETETSNDDFLIKEETSISSSQTSPLENAFLPNYTEDNHREMESIDSELDVGYSAYQMEPSTRDIFRVWDLGIPPEEEDELVKQLNKALSESNVQLMPSTTDDSGASKDLIEESVDDLIAGLAEMSLS
ncbi:hypothetical protein JCGZ_19648 [Jatropha curcas]|uniref:Uncharacterized protein n=1 Tax=Jatropha curcas TaxID=180498 RepID=A0A067JXV8_JATCU|nr:uncharacterized protein LOC105643839 isoform X1 [Jatropha curcas]KDP27643.1 hypothetical protein JCGZ_19648 [Jatropha curcas]